MRFPFVSFVFLFIVVLWPVAAACAESKSDSPAGKPPDVMTVNGITQIVPPQGVQPVALPSPSDAMPRMLPAPPAIARPLAVSPVVAPAAPRGHGLSEVLGPLPRAAWASGAPLPPKPAEIVTSLPALPSMTAAPMPEEGLPVVTPAAGMQQPPKPSEFRTSQPRNPNAPPPSSVKPAASRDAKPEVRP